MVKFYTFGNRMVELKKKPQILLIDDNLSEGRLFTEMVRECGLEEEIEICFFSESSAAWTFLNGTERPDLILLDLNLPHKGGIDLLGEIKTHATLRTIPVLVMTTSNHEQDVRKAYERHANAYVIKPVNIKDYIHVIQSIYNFWFKTALLHP